jgi:hypothetical protein
VAASDGNRAGGTCARRPTLLGFAIEEQRQLPAHKIDRCDHVRVVRVKPLGDHRFTFGVIHVYLEADAHRPGSPRFGVRLVLSGNPPKAGWWPRWDTEQISDETLDGR